MLHELSPNSRTDRPIIHSDAGVLSTVIAPAASEEPKNNAFQRLGAGLRGGRVEGVGPPGGAEPPQVEHRGREQQASSAGRTSGESSGLARQSGGATGRRSRSRRALRCGAGAGDEGRRAPMPRRCGRLGRPCGQSCGAPVRRQAGRQRQGERRCRPGRLSTSTSPPCACTTAARSRAPARCCRRRGSGTESPRAKRSKISRRRLRGDARPVVVHRQHDVVAVRDGRPTVTVVPGGVCVRALDSRFASTWCSRCSSPGTVTGSAGRSSRQWCSGPATRASLTASTSSATRSTGAFERAAGVQAGQQEQVLDERGHPRGLGLDLADRVRDVGGGLAAAAPAQLGVPADRRQRGAQLVARVGDELAYPGLALVPGGRARRRRGRACGSSARPT